MLGLLASGVAPHAHHGVHAGVAQVQCPRTPLIAVADDRDGLAFERAHVSVALVIDGGHDARTYAARPEGGLLPCCSAVACAMATGRPNRSTRPPKAIDVSANQPH